MKKLLSILASFGLTATTAISVVSCGTDKGESETKEQIEAKVPEKAYSIGLEKTPKDEKLNEEDQKKVEKIILEKLTKLNEGAIINNDETFVFKLTEVTTNTKLIPIEVKETQSTSEKPGLKAKKFDLKVNFTLPEDKNELLRQIDEIISQTLVVQKNLGKDIKAEDVQKQIQEKLKDFEQDLELKEVKDTFVPISADLSNNQFDITNGSLALNIFFSEESLVNPETNNDQFKFTFINNDYQDYDQVNQVLTKIKESPTINLSNLEIDLGEIGGGTLGDFLQLGAMAFSLIPNKIPAQFDDSDEAWVAWQGTLNTLRPLLEGMGINIDEKMAFSFELDFEGFKGTLNLEITISQLLTAILPDLIHLRNFLNEQIKLESDNLILLLIQYLFEKPRDIDNDGFASLNQQIPNVNKPSEFIQFNTNLERLAHDLLHGWQNADGIMWKEAQNNNLDPVLVKGEFLGGLLELDFKYQQKQDTNEVAIFELLPIENIKSVITQLFNYDLNQSLKLEINLPIDVESGKNGKANGIVVDIDLGSLIKSNLPNILKMHPDLKDQLDIANLSFDWKAGRLQVEILNSENNWVIPQKFDDLLTTKDIRIKFIAETLDIKYSDLVVTLNDIDLTFNLDLKASTLIPQEQN